MDSTQMVTIIGSILVPVLAAFGWVIHICFGIKNDIRDIEKRLSRIEGVFREGARWQSRRNERDR